MSRDAPRLLCAHVDEPRACGRRQRTDRRSHDHSIVPTRTRAAVLPSELREIAEAQSGIVSRRQLRALGVERWHVRDQVRAGRWRVIGSRVVVLHGGELTERQHDWVAVLHAGPTAALARRSALAAAGLRGWPAEAVHVVVAKGVRVPPLPGLVVHQSRDQGEVDWRRSPPRVRVERAAVDAASATSEPRMGCALMAAVVQQRLTTPARLQVALLTARCARHRRVLLAVLADIEGGAHALSEIDFVALCRRSGLPVPFQQVIRTDRYGKRRYLDALWRLPDGSTLVVEIDGALHLLARTYWDDMDRQNELVLSGDRILRFPSATVRLHAERVAEQLRRALGI